MRGIVRVAGGPERRVTTCAGLDDGPDYAPDGRWLYYNSMCSGKMEIWRVRPDGAGAEQLTRDAYSNWFPHPSLDGRWVVYRSKLDPPQGAVRLTSVVGGRNPAHTTAVGKLLLAGVLTTEAAVRDWAGDRPLTTPTERSIGGAAELHAELQRVRERGYATDNQENEPGVNCLAVPAFLLLSVPFVAVVVFPVATAAGTLLARELLSEPTALRHDEPRQVTGG